MDYTGHGYVDPIGIAGGLCIWWNNNVDVKVISSNKNMFDTVVSDNKNNQMLMTWIYGPNDFNERQVVWRKLKDLSRGHKDPWTVAGDFNDIASSKGKTGGGMKEARCIQNFLDMMSEAKLKTLASKGLQYTWSNKREEEVRERIDRVLVNTSWIEKFPNSAAEILPMLGSDHCPMLLRREVKESRSRKMFKFELNWAEEKECVDVVKENWKTNSTGSHGFKLMRKLKVCSKGLIEWSKKHFPDNRKLIDELTEKIKVLQEMERNEENRNQIMKYEEDLEEAWKREERFWYQRSRIKWLL